jgi:hypothetical protein
VGFSVGTTASVGFSVGTTAAVVAVGSVTFVSWVGVAAGWQAARSIAKTRTSEAKSQTDFRIFSPLKVLVVCDVQHHLPGLVVVPFDCALSMGCGGAQLADESHTNVRIP